MNNLVRLCPYIRRFSIRRLHTEKYILDAENRQLYEDIFPDIHIDDIKKLWNKPPQCVYAGFDPTAESLHIGNLLVLMNLLHWQRRGHQVIILLGGATGLIGDPSFRKSERVEIENVVLQENLLSIKNDIEKVFKNHETYFYTSKQRLLPPIIHNNLEWYKDLNIISFIRENGKYFRMGTMLNRTSVQSRLQSDSGMSFTEFSYPLFQGYDWLHLKRTYNCNFQIGGQDQMGNIMSGYDLVTKSVKKQVYGLTLPLVTAEGGKKFGKSTGNAVWLSPSKSSSFQLYQYFVRAEDADVEKLLHLFTFMPLSKIKVIVKNHFKNPDLRIAQKILAENVTLLVHGEEGVISAKKTSAMLYDRSIEALSKLSPNELSQLLEGAPLVDILSETSLSVYDLAMKANCFKTEHDARRIISAGGFYINYQKITNAEEILVPGIHILSNNVTLLRVGKKNYYVVRWV
ncbi:tyrosine--tRNA ligase, mitochondrial [Hylaeus volcanicus]|uniref:tyrosine--tRNA ligase, mitochondrial n=1 Tax=Hylaeus volcanicus TaxID=313075 RepID=UPI0023B7920B|nr:tyrosine--tRNA ligase, mitochondrial [Hylaeus volcanicus]